MHYFLAIVFTFYFVQLNAQNLPVNHRFIDSTVIPGDDFYRFANGRWLNTTPIPVNQDMWSPIIEVYQKNTQYVESRIQQLATQPHKASSAAQLLGDFYASGMDTNQIEALGYRPLVPYFKAVDQIRSRQDLLDFVARHLTTPTNALVNLYAEPDGRNKQIQLAILGQAGLAFPASYYLGRNDKSRAILNQYTKYLTRQFTSIDYSPSQATKAAERITALECHLAKGHYTTEQLRQPSLAYTITSMQELNQQHPHLGWPRFFALSPTRPRRINLAQPNYYHLLDSLVNVVPIATWKDKLKSDYITAHALKLSCPFRTAHFTFFGQTLAGQQQPERQKQAVMNRIIFPLRDLVGQLYVQERFSAAAKQAVMRVFNQVRTVYANRLTGATWLSNQARAEALRKLQQMTKKIGYPNRWETYTGVLIRRTDFFGNTIRLAQRNRLKNLRSFDRPVDTSIWRFMIAGTGASYSNTENAITLTAGYLQPPYFWPEADAAANYATIGRTIGHELTHAFDTKGYRYNAQGELAPWFTPADSARFVGRYLPLLNQFARYTLPDSLKTDAQRTIGENIADLVGLSVAYQAFTATNQFKRNVPIAGLTPAQRFFLAYAQEQRSLYTPSTIRAMQKDAHPLEEFRVNGTLSNFSPFYDAFNVQSTNKLYKPTVERVIIW